MLNRQKIATIIEDNWDLVKQEMLAYWDQLTADDVNEMTGYDSLVSKLSERYAFTEEKMLYEIDRFLEKMNLFPIDVRLKELKDALYQSAVASTSRISRNIQNSVNNLKDSSQEFHNNTINYIQKNPVQSMLFAVLGGMVLKSLLDKK